MFAYMVDNHIKYSVVLKIYERLFYILYWNIQTKDQKDK